MPARPEAAALPLAGVPRATYRLQLHRGFGFDDAIGTIPYLARLGVSHVYCSPILRARPGSTHGYDIVAFDEINPELGGRAGFDRFSATLRAHGLGLLLDMVPNHMGVLGADNAWWMDVLENGPASRHAHYFDIDWSPANPRLAGKVLVPVLGGLYGDVLDRGEIVLRFERDAGVFALGYFDHRFPLDPRTYVAVLERAAAYANDDETNAALAMLVSAFRELPDRDALAVDLRDRRAQEKELHKRSLQRFANVLPPFAYAIDAAVNTLNTPEQRDALHALLEAQAYRLAYWRVAADEINYRRFFDINELAALRMEDEEVFEATHGLVLDLAAAGAIDGLRIDHPDGLRDPAQYFERLQQGYARRAATPQDNPMPLYVVIEKIVAPHEKVPTTWKCHGTTGYRFANAANGLLVDTSARARIDRVWRMFAHEEPSFEEMAWRGKHAIMQGALASERTRLANELLRIAQANRRTRDYTYNMLRQALLEVTACLPVYRTYIVDSASPQDRRYIDWAIALARKRSRDIDGAVFDFLHRTLLGEAEADASETTRAWVIAFAQRYQQFSAPVTAKGTEDTAFYRYCRLVSLNEVGGDPAVFGMMPRAFHVATAKQAQRWPHTMLATSTHDNKRSEDVRNRIDVLSEMPAAWRLMLRRWHTMNHRHKAVVDAASAPSSTDEYLLYQTLLGTAPIGAIDEAALADWRERMQAYMTKAAREAKLHTSWVNPEPEYETALQAFVDALLKRVEPNPFLDDLRRQTEAIAWFGALNSLSLTLLKCTAPGVPDIYQGTELMDFSLVDPDNRRPVDYVLRERLLHALDSAPDIATSLHDGRAKLWLTARLLQLRKQFAEVFRDGTYLPLRVSGAHAEHVIAYARRCSAGTLVVIAGRLFAKLLGDAGRVPTGDAVWKDTTVTLPELASGAWRDGLNGEALSVGQGSLRLDHAFSRFPGAVLIAA